METTIQDVKRWSKGLLILGLFLMSGFLPLVSQPNQDCTGISFLPAHELTTRDSSFKSATAFRYTSDADKSFTTDLICTEEEVDRRSSFQKGNKIVLISIPYFFATLYNFPSEAFRLPIFSTFRHFHLPSAYRSAAILFQVFRL